MSEQSRFFDYVLEDGVPDRQYSADEFAEYFRRLLTNGIFNGGTNLQVSHVQDLTVNVNDGFAWIEGYMYKVDGGVNLELDLGSPDNDRIDRVVLQLNTEMDVRAIKAMVKKGTPATEPEPPALTREGDIYELSLAQIYVEQDAENITDDDITDERLDENVCGQVNSLIQVETSQFQNEWDDWADLKFRYDTSEFPQEWKDWFEDQQTEGYFLLDDEAHINKHQALNQRVDERNEVLTYTDGNLTKVEEYETSAQDNLIKETNLTYTDGNLVEVEEIIGDTTVTETLNYDADGNLESVERSVT